MTRKTTAGYAVIAWAREQEAGSSSEAHLLLLLATYADASGVCHPSMATLSKQLGLKPRRIRQLEAELERRGLIEREQTKRPNGRFGLNRYRLLINRRQRATGGKGLPTAKDYRRQSAASPAALSDPTGGTPLPRKELPKRTDKRNSKELRKKAKPTGGDKSPSHARKQRDASKSHASASRTAKKARRQPAADGTDVNKRYPTEFDQLAARFGPDMAARMVKGRKRQ